VRHWWNIYVLRSETLFGLNPDLVDDMARPGT